MLPQTRNFPLPLSPLMPQLQPPSASLQNISSWLLSSLPNIENLNDGIQQVLSTENHPSNNYQMMTYEVQNTPTSKTIILESENHMTTISLNQYFSGGA